jgi:uncharacterized membrane protein
MSNHLLTFEMPRIKGLVFFLILKENSFTKFDEENSPDRSKKKINFNK